VQDELADQLYQLGQSLGFSLAHIRRAIERAKRPDLLLRKWRRWSVEEVRYMAWSGSGRDYLEEPLRGGLGEMPPSSRFWKSMRDEPEPVSETWHRKQAA
jgi:hypothetical protein